MYAASRFLALFGAACLTRSRAYARCRDVRHIPRHGMGHAEQRRPLSRSCKRYSRMHVVARWPHRELHRAAEKFKLRHYPKIENFRCLMTRSFLRCTSQTARFRSKSALNALIGGDLSAPGGHSGRQACVQRVRALYRASGVPKGHHFWYWPEPATYPIKSGH